MLIKLGSHTTNTDSVVQVRDLRINKIPIFEREGWLCQPSLSKIGILLIRRSLEQDDCWKSSVVRRFLNNHPGSGRIALQAREPPSK